MQSKKGRKSIPIRTLLNQPPRLPPKSPPRSPPRQIVGIAGIAGTVSPQNVPLQRVSPQRITLPLQRISPQMVSPTSPIVPIRVTPRAYPTGQLEEAIEPGTPVEEFVSLVIKEQDADIAQEKEYLGYVKYLLNAEDKYDIFARIYPEYTCENISIRVEPTHVWIRPFPSALVKCITDAEKRGNSVAIRLSFERHANALWFDTKNKIINRYDPASPGEEDFQRKLDLQLSLEFDNLFPNYAYIGNTLEDFMCVQGVRAAGRRYKADYFCQDYSLLYAIRRAKGMSHEEAAWDLVEKRDEVTKELEDLLRVLVYKKRQELGRTVPPKFARPREIFIK